MMNRLYWLIGSLMAFTWFTFSPNGLAGDDYCPTECMADTGTVYSPGNIYRCYGTGNCTWWAWAVANDPSKWGDALPNFGNARDWAANARAAHYGIRYVPAVDTIAVNSTLAGGLGHVAWVDTVNPDGTLRVTDMAYAGWCGWTFHPYSVSTFDQGFIYPRPRVTSMFPSNPTVAPYDQLVTLIGSNFQNAQNTKVLVTFPGGGQAYLSGAQIPYVDQGQMNLLVTFGGGGWWRFQVQNEDGGWSDPWVFYVN